jgi:Tfp pilus assembly protein FimT
MNPLMKTKTKLTSFQSKHGLTMVELLITLVIAISLASLSVLTMSQYMPRQRLISSTETVEQALSQAQYEATSRVLWTCVQYDTNLNQLHVIVDANNDHGAADACGNTGTNPPDFTVASLTLSDNVSFADCSDSGETGDGNPFGTGPVWFDTAGSPRLCVAGNCTIRNLEFIVVNENLPATNRTREVEASGSGLIEVIARGEVGYNTLTFAKTPTGDTSTGCE